MSALTSRRAGQPPAALETSKLAQWVVVALLCLAAALRLWQYLGDASLWIDELALTRSILDRGPLALVSGPLEFGQSAAPGFLLLEKLAVMGLGSSELALRLVPLLGSLLAIPIFWALARQTLPWPGVIAATAFFALAPNLTLRAGDVKQYATGVATSLLIVLLGMRWLRSPSSRRATALALAVGLGPWFSRPALFTALAVLLALAVAPGAGSATERRRLLRYCLPALVAAALAAIHAQLMITGAERVQLFKFWGEGLIPWDPRGALSWIAIRLPQPFRSELALDVNPARLFAALVPVGWWALWRGDRRVALLVMAPVLAALGAAAAHVYPFTGRLVTFLTPLVAIAFGAALSLFWLGNARWIRLGGVIAMLLALAPLARSAVARRPVVRREESRPLLEYLAAQRRLDEPVYVFFTGRQAIAYYGPRLGIAPEGLIVGSCGLRRPATYRAEVNRLAGARRAWIFFVHEPTVERDALVAYLDSVAVREDSLVTNRWPPSRRRGASLYAFDLRAMPTALDTTVSTETNPNCRFVGPLKPFDALAAYARP